MNRKRFKEPKPESDDDNQPKTIGKEWRAPELEDWYFEVVKYLKDYSK
jgi:hypothetical protein